MQINFDIHGGNVEQEARRLGLKANKIIDASASIVPFNLPKKLTYYLLQSIKNESIKFYPDRTYYHVNEVNSAMLVVKFTELTK